MALVAPSGVKPQALPPPDAPPARVDQSPAARAALALQHARGICTVDEDAFAREFVLRRNATAAFIAITPNCLERMQRYVARTRGYELTRRPAVAQRIREYESAAAAGCVIDVAALLESDRRIVEAASHAEQLSQHVWQACRYCHGTEHKYQWIDFAEYLAALSKVEEQNEARRLRKTRPLSMPDDAGGYGFSPQAEPNITCPKCEGRGQSVTILCDTTKLEGPAAALFKGVRTTANGTELLMHDVDKAKERLLRAAGAFHDDAASVAGAAARGAAAGSAAGAAAAQAVAERVKDMSADEVRRAYLGLIGRE